jgi:hypothetical protein
MAWVNSTGPSVLGPGKTDAWYWWFGQQPEVIVIQPLPHSAGGTLRIVNQSVERQLDGTTTHYIDVINDGAFAVEYHLEGVFLMQP